MLEWGRLHPRDVEEVYLGGQGVFNAKGPSRIVVDMSTSRPSLARIIADKAAGQGIDSLDAPRSFTQPSRARATAATVTRSSTWF